MKTIFTGLFIFISLFASAKKVKFAVDMSTYTISAFGIHVMGDFQAAAGYTLGNWQPGTTQLIQEGSSTVYSIIVDIPAFQKYEYKFINGDQSYEAEFVPDQSRVGHFFNDNRWIYVDSLANDTTFVGAIKFSGNAPAGLNLIRFIVDMSDESAVLSNSVQLGASFQGFNPTKTIMYSFIPYVYEVISYTTQGTYEYKYYNGNTLSNAEIVPGSCAVNNNRSVQVASDTVLTKVCFSKCGACITASMMENKFSANKLNVFPNPTNNFTNIQLNESLLPATISIVDVTGRVIQKNEHTGGEYFKLNTNNFNSGIYFVEVTYANKSFQATRLLKE